MFNKKYIRIWVIAIVVLTITSVVYAAHVTIDTDNAMLDAAWSNVSMLLDSAEWGDVGNTNYDIGEVWVGNDASPPSEIYFRADLEGTLLAFDRLEARVDCTGDNDFTDTQDVIVYYQLNVGGEDVSECQGNLYTSGCPFNFIEQNGDTYGEEITGSPNSYEWKADISGDTSWSACLDNLKVQFASMNDGSEIDVTDWQEADYSVPNSVTLAGFTAQGNLVASAVAIIVGVMTLGIFMVLRQRNG